MFLVAQSSSFGFCLVSHATFRHGGVQDKNNGLCESTYTPVLFFVARTGSYSFDHVSSSRFRPPEMCAGEEKYSCRVVETDNSLGLRGSFPRLPPASVGLGLLPGA